MKIILCSSSVYRKLLLSQLYPSFSTFSPDIDEKKVGTLSSDLVSQESIHLGFDIINNRWNADAVKSIKHLDLGGDADIEAIHVERANLAPEVLTLSVAFAKLKRAKEVFLEDAILIASDQVAVYKNEIREKPESDEV